MRYYSFISLAVIALILDVVLLGVGWLNPSARPRLSEPAVAQAAPPLQTATQLSLAPTRVHQPSRPTATPTATSIPPSPTPSPTPTATATATAIPPTATPAPRLIAQNQAAFTPSDRAVRANIRLALDHYYGALTHIALPPGATFSFNSTLGVYPPALPWKDVVVRPTAAPAPTAAPDAPPEAPPPAAPPASPAQRIEGGGLCDLASRYVMAARKLLPARAFRFVNHVRSNGVHLKGVPDRDAVSIWAVGGGRSEHDLLITNVTSGWLEFVVERDGEKITVIARLWDGIPPDW